MENTTHGPVIVLELNELCPPIIDKLMARGELPNFKKLHGVSDVHVTWTDEHGLEPWVQWVTLHTGQKQAVHGAKQLDEGYRIDLPRVWDMLGDKGVTSLVFGSMNSRKFSDQVFLVPDPWSVRIPPSDPAYMAFHQFIAFHVAEHTNARAKPTRQMTKDFVSFMLRRGLSFSTIVAALRQLTSEKYGGKDMKWARAMILDLLMWDVFENEYRRRKPQFATFFANSTAFVQHRYWRHMEPEVYTVKPSESEMHSFGDAIAASYRHMDQLVGKAMRLVGAGGRIVFATGLSQEANLRYESIGGKYVYRPHDFKELNAWVGGPANLTFEPVMLHQAWASCGTEERALAFVKAMEGLHANGASIMECRRHGDRVFFCNTFLTRVPQDLVVTNMHTGATTRFDALFSLIGQVNNSKHNRDGAFWVQRADGVGHVHADKLPLERSTSLLLALFGVETPEQPGHAQLAPAPAIKPEPETVEA